MTMISSLKLYSISLLCFSWFFWSWALKNTIQKNYFDLGLISFMTVMLTSSYLLEISSTDITTTTNNNSSPLSSSPSIVIGKLTRILVTSSCIFVSINYILGAYIGYTKLQRTGFTIYCSIFALLWFGIAGVGMKIMSSSSQPQSHSSSPPQSTSTSGERQNLC